jgi:hypothetical protein
MKTQKVKKTGTSAKTTVAKAKAENRKLPPDPYGDFKRGAARAKKVIALYEKFDAGLELEYRVSDIVRDLICLSAQEPRLGNVDRACVFAMETYLEFAAENMWAARWYDDMEAAKEAAERMLYPHPK